MGTHGYYEEGSGVLVCSVGTHGYYEEGCGVLVCSTQGHYDEVSRVPYVPNGTVWVLTRPFAYLDLSHGLPHRRDRVHVIDARHTPACVRARVRV